MPPRLNILEKRWSTFDSPILPFLAPNIFEPWPSYTRQNFLQRRELQKRAGYAKQVKEGSPKHKQSPRSNSSHRLKAEDEEFVEKYREIWSSPPMEESQLSTNMVNPPRKPRQNIVRFTPSTSHVTLAFKYLSVGPSKSTAHGAWMETRKRRQAQSRKAIQDRINKEVLKLGLPKSRPRYISLPLRYRYRFAWTVGEWNRRFAVLNQPYDNLTNDGPVPGQVLYHSRRHPVRIPEGFERALVEQASATSFRKLWEGIDLRTRTKLWPEVMMTALETFPDVALNFLEATYQHPYPPAFVVSNCLEYIISNRYSRPTSQDSKGNELFVYKIRLILYLGAQKKVHLSQDAIYRLIKNSSVSTNTQLYVTMKQLKHQLHENTLLQFASHLGKKSSVGAQRALKVLEQMKDQGTLMNTAKALSVFSTMLDRDDRDANARALDSAILQFMMESGASPNIITYNILLRNSLRDGEHETGWKIYQMMRENGIEPSAFTYSTLLNDSKKRMDAERMREIVSIVKEKGIQDAYIITDVLHAIFLLQHDQEKRALGYHGSGSQPKTIPAFLRMFGVYSEFFQSQPLRDLVPAIAAEDRSQSMVDLHDPPACTLVVMVTAYLAHLKSPSGLQAFYDHFLALLAAGNTTALDLAKMPHFWSVLIINFSRFEDNLARCPEVIGYMLQHLPEIAKQEDIIQIEPDPIQPEFAAKVNYDPKSLEPVPDKVPSNSTEIAKPLEIVPSRRNTAAPNVYTWSILLKIFMDHRQPRAAEKVLEMMKEHGVEPNMVTWNTLVVGYSKMQATLETVDAVGRMEDAGFSPDDITFTALHRLNDKRTMMAAMQRYEQLKVKYAALKRDSKSENTEQDEDEMESDELIRTWDQAGGDFTLHNAEKTPTRMLVRT